MEIQLAEEKLRCCENSLEKVYLAHGFSYDRFKSKLAKHGALHYTALLDAKAFESITFIFESIHIHNAVVMPTR